MPDIFSNVPMTAERGAIAQAAADLVGLDPFTASSTVVCGDWVIVPRDRYLRLQEALIAASAEHHRLEAGAAVGVGDRPA